MIDREKMLLELITNLEEDKIDLQKENKRLEQEVADYFYKLANYSREETYIREINELKEKIDNAITITL